MNSTVSSIWKQLRSPSPIVKHRVAKITLETVNFSNYKFTNSNFKDFTFPSDNRIEFCLIIYPKFRLQLSNQDYTYVSLILRKAHKDQLFVRYRISILNSNGHKCMTQERVDNFSLATKEKYGFYQIDHDYLMDPKNGLLVNGKLTIYCEVEEIDSQNLNLTNCNSDSDQKIPCNPTSQNYKSLLESGKFSDATLVVGEKKLVVHKAILAAQSKVFSAMFESDCEEKRQNSVEITDISVEVCELMLYYIYTGNVPELGGEYTGELFVASDKYQLDHLKIACEQSLSSSIDVESATSTLLVADMHSATLLMTKCIEYIVEHAQDVIKTEGWKHLAKTRPDLAVQLFECAFSDNKK